MNSIHFTSISVAFSHLQPILNPIPAYLTSQQGPISFWRQCRTKQLQSPTGSHQWKQAGELLPSHFGIKPEQSTRKTFLISMGYWTSTSTVRAHHQNHHAINYGYIPNMTVDLILLPLSKTDPGHIPLPSCCTRHFSLPHHMPVFIRINLHDTNHGKQPIFFFLLPGRLIPTLAQDSFHLPMA